jgi:hypothetical protein
MVADLGRYMRGPGGQLEGWYLAHRDNMNVDNQSGRHLKPLNALSLCSEREPGYP